MSVSAQSSIEGAVITPQGSTVRFMVQTSPNLNGKRVTMARSCSDLNPSLINCNPRDSVSSVGSSIISPLPNTYRASSASHRGSGGEQSTSGFLPHNSSMSSRGSTSSNLLRELQLIGQCKNCNKDYKCTCCQKCNHLMVLYMPVSCA